MNNFSSFEFFKIDLFSPFLSKQIIWYNFNSTAFLQVFTPPKTFLKFTLFNFLPPNFSTNFTKCGKGGFKAPFTILSLFTFFLFLKGKVLGAVASFHLFLGALVVLVSILVMNKASLFLGLF